MCATALQRHESTTNSQKWNRPTQEALEWCHRSSCHDINAVPGGIRAAILSSPAKDDDPVLKTEITHQRLQKGSSSQQRLNKSY
jgi:hypothetical protein